MAAVTLAGAAEEILGKLLAGRPTAFQQVRSSFSGGDHGLTDKQLADEYLNRARTWFKYHGDPSDTTTVFELETETISCIHRAMLNLLHYDASWPSEGPRFDNWVAVNRPDLGKPHLAATLALRSPSERKAELDEHFARSCASQRRILESNDRALDLSRRGVMRSQVDHGDGRGWVDITQERIAELERQNKEICDFLKRFCQDAS